MQLDVIPGLKLCPSCHVNMQKQWDLCQISTEEGDNDTEITSDIELTHDDTSINLNNTLTEQYLIMLKLLA